MSSQLDKEIWAKIVDYLPQHDKISFLLTCYDNYLIAIASLYRSLLFKRASSLPQQSVQYTRFTLVGCAKNILIKEEVHDLVYQRRQEILLQSFQVNPELLTYVKEVVIFDDHKSTYEPCGSHLINYELVDLLKSKCPELHNYMVFNTDPLLHLTEFQHLHQLRSCMINHVHQLQQLPSSVTQLTVNFTDSYKKEIKESAFVDKIRCLKALVNLDTLILSSDELSTYIFLKFLLEVLKPVSKFKLRTLKLIFYHGFNDYNVSLRTMITIFVFKFVDLTYLENLEIIMGCDEQDCDCLTTFLDELNCQTNDYKAESKDHLCKLTRLSITEKTLHLNHDFQEKFDVALGRLVYNLPYPDKLKYLSIRHQPPLDGTIENGVEGNFLRRKKLYSHSLVKLVNLETLISPSFLQTCSCYEVITSDLLWNGCRCSFCEQHLALFDEFIISHSYYDETTGQSKDVITPRFFSVAGDSISKRLITYSDISFNCSDLTMLEYPVFRSYWDFHSYFGFKHHESEDLCHFNQSVFGSLCRVVSHFEETFADALYEILPKLQMVCLSGIFFKRIPHSAHCENIYDEVETKKNIVGPHDYVLPKN